MSKMDQQSPGANVSEGGSGEVPPSGRRRRDVFGEEAPPPLSRFALRDDGHLLLSIEDAADRDFGGRALQTYLVLTSDEIGDARQTADDGISAAAAQVIGGLPKK